MARVRVRRHRRRRRCGERNRGLEARWRHRRPVGRRAVAAGVDRDWCPVTGRLMQRSAMAAAIVVWTCAAVMAQERTPPTKGPAAAGARFEVFLDFADETSG